MSVKSSGSHDGPTPSRGNIIRWQTLRKLKTGKKKFFVIRAETPDTLARLEYYDNEKKFRSGTPPKRCIPLKTCFDINKRQDTKYKHVIALYTKDDCFGIVMDNEEEMKSWLKDLLTLQHGEEMPEGETPKPKFEYVWEGELCERGLGNGYKGSYRLCMTDKTITLISRDRTIPIVIELSLNHVRSCGNLKNFFFLEIGRSSPLGAGDFWFEVDDTNIAANMQVTVSHRFNLAQKKAGIGYNAEVDFFPNGRIRSSSATESSKSSTKTLTSQEGSTLTPGTAPATTLSESVAPPVAVSTPSAASTVSGVAMSIYHHLQRGCGLRRHSISGAGASWSGGANHQRTQSLPLTTVPVTTSSDSTFTASIILSQTTNHANQQHNASRFNQQPSSNKYSAGASQSNDANPQYSRLVTGVAPSTSENTFTAIITLSQITNNANQQLIAKRYNQQPSRPSFRERCDSMPSRPRTSSEGNHVTPGYGRPYLVPYRSHLRDATHTPSAGSPISPPSDSTGSSYSLPDEHDSLPHEGEPQRIFTTLTPDEAIAEEECPESPRATNPESNYLCMTNPESNYLCMNPQTSDSHYVEMHAQNYPSTSASMSSVTSGTPSTDMRFAYYPLDKVVSYVSADDEDARPCRAYSVGSKPLEQKAQLASTPENSRVRAFSVGSKTKKYFNRVFPTHHSHPPGVKSSSAPILAANSRTGSSHSSINNPMEDLMEMDFSSGTSRSRTSTGSSGVCTHRNGSCNANRILSLLENFTGDHKKTPEGYVEMKPGGRTTSGSTEVSPYVDMTQGQKTVQNESNVPSVGHAYSPYMDMSGNNNINSHNSTFVGNGNAPYMDMSGNIPASQSNYMEMSGSSPVRHSPRTSSTLAEYSRQFGHRTSQAGNHNNDYVDMNQGRRRANSNSSHNAASPGAWNTDHSTDYLDMSGRNSSRRSERNSFSSQMSSSPHFDSISPTSNYGLFGAQSNTTECNSHDVEGYVHMSPGDFSSIRKVNSHPRQMSLDGTDNEHGDYLNMSGSSFASSTGKPAKKERSQPISIQTTSNSQSVKNSSPITISSLLSRKLSPTSNSPKMHLPLSFYSSLPRQKSSRKNSSKDSSTVSSSVTTPSSSSTMFPLSLNSPSSPTNITKATTPSSSGVKIPASVLSVPYKSSESTKKNTYCSDDYAMMDFESSKGVLIEAKKNEDAYMNYCPGPDPCAARTPLTVSQKNEDQAGDYAFMRPGGFAAKSSTLPKTKGGASSGMASPLANHLSAVGIADRQSSSFRPITEKDERIQSPRLADQVPDRLSIDDRALETANMEVDNERPYDTLQSPSMFSKVLRPNSANSGQTHFISGDEKDTTRLGSTSSVYSSTSTLIGIPRTEECSECPNQQQEVRLNYATLDLSNDRNSPNATLQQSGATFVYADIDFIKSEELSRANAGTGSSSTGAIVKN